MIKNWNISLLWDKYDACDIQNALWKPIAMILCEFCFINILVEISLSMTAFDFEWAFSPTNFNEKKNTNNFNENILIAQCV